MTCGIFKLTRGRELRRGISGCSFGDDISSQFHNPQRSQLNKSAAGWQRVSRTIKKRSYESMRSVEFYFRRISSTKIFFTEIFLLSIFHLILAREVFTSVLLCLQLDELFNLLVSLLMNFLFKHKVFFSARAPSASVRDEKPCWIFKSQTQADNKQIGLNDAIYQSN